MYVWSFFVGIFIATSFWIYREWGLIEIKHNKFKLEAANNWSCWWDDTYQIRQGTIDCPYDPSPKPRIKRGSNASV